ncbi:MAG TPA: fibronectin type III domain-containing protein [Usitatibacter sp.]|nr:fibronectin type III domain-containing protein [Usitatibacter sp.]
MRIAAGVLVLVAAAACSGGGGGSTATVPPAPFVLQWSANLSAATVAASNAASATFSSTRLALSWSAPSNLIPARYDVHVTEGSSSTARVIGTTATSLALDGLKSATDYRIEVRACDDTTCHAQPAAVATATTPAEVWQLQGTGRTFAGLARLVSDGNVKLHVLRLGEGAGGDLPGRLRLYYGASGPNVRGLSVALNAAPVSAAQPSTYLAFSSRAGSSGLVDPSSASPLVRGVATGQAVALSASAGARVRLYFEALGADGRNRILSVDSQDGYAGLDFNAGSATLCSTAAEYSAGGGCAPTVVIGSEGDATQGWPRILNARQFKIGVPTQTDWRWDMATGSFMVFTTDSIAGCSLATPNQAYAVWDGTQWIVQYESNGCPKLFSSMQAAHPLHLGGDRFKLYYGDPSDRAGRITTSMLPFLGPKKVMYAEASRSGDPARVDFEDWDGTANARPLTFLWPDGSELDAHAEGYIDDFSIVAPTGSLDLQVLYLAITDGIVAPFTAVAVLLNP